MRTSRVEFFSGFKIRPKYSTYNTLQSTTATISARLHQQTRKKRPIRQSASSVPDTQRRGDSHQQDPRHMDHHYSTVQNCSRQGSDLAEAGSSRRKPHLVFLIRQPQILPSIVAQGTALYRALAHGCNRGRSVHEPPTRRRPSMPHAAPHGQQIVEIVTITLRAVDANSTVFAAPRILEARWPLLLNPSGLELVDALPTDGISTRLLHNPAPAHATAICHISTRPQYP